MAGSRSVPPPSIKGGTQWLCGGNPSRSRPTRPSREVIGVSYRWTGIPDLQAPPADQAMDVATDNTAETQTVDESVAESTEESSDEESAAEPLTSGAPEESSVAQDSQEESNWPPEPMD